MSSNIAVAISVASLVGCGISIWFARAAVRTARQALQVDPTTKAILDENVVRMRLSRHETPDTPDMPEGTDGGPDGVGRHPGRQD